MNSIRIWLIRQLLAGKSLDSAANNLTSQALVYLAEQIAKNAEQYNRAFFAQKISDASTNLLAECIKVNKNLSDMQKIQIASILESPRPAGDTSIYLR